MSKVLVVAVHPDDETLGCGGTLLKHKADGDEIHWMIATETNDTNGTERRDSEISQVARLYGFNSINRLSLPTTKVDTYDVGELVARIASVINEIRPDTIYLPFKGDVHSDHKYIFDAAYSCTKSFRYPFIKRIYMMEILSETEFSTGIGGDYFVPNVFVDISKYLDKKVKIMNVYKDEMDMHPFPRSEKNIKALATYRGATFGCRYAESFMLLKEIRD